MAKLLISFLGTNNYVACNYYLEQKPDQRAENVRFVQEAVVDFFCTGWGGEDRIAVFLTDEARNRNWKNTVDDKNEEKEGLESVLKKKRLPCQILAPEIREGFSENEIWKTFQAVYEVINDGDEVILDITHSFRSIPMLGIVLMNYARVLKNIKIQGIYYGAFEKLGPAYQVSKMSIGERNAPVINITSFVNLQDWTWAIRSYLQSGDASLIAELGKEGVSPLLRASGGSDEMSRRIRDFANGTGNLTEYYRLCRGNEIRDFSFDKFNENLSALASENEGVYIKPMAPLISRVKEDFSESSTGDVFNLIRAARWCFSHGLVQQAVTLLQEGSITVICEATDRDSTDDDTRKAVNYAAGTDADPEKFNGDAKDFVKLLTEDSRFTEIREIMESLGSMRNDINHAGLKENSMKLSTIKNKFEEDLNRLEAALRDLDKQP